MTRKQKASVSAMTALTLSICLTSSAHAMHIMEGMLPMGNSIIWAVLCLPFIALGVTKIRNIVKTQPKALLLLAMAGAYAFVLSALKIPSVTGSSSHPTGTGLAAILFGPLPTTVIGLIVLLFQAILLAHGGITTLGANTFSMAIAGPFLSWGLFKLCEKMNVSKLLSVFLASSIGSFFTYCVTSIQLGIAIPSADIGIVETVLKFLGIFAVTQIPISIIEGILTVVVVMGLEAWAKPELREIGYLKGV